MASIGFTNISLSNLVTFVASNAALPYSMSKIYGFSNISQDTFSTGAINFGFFKGTVYLPSNLKIDIPFTSSTFPTVDRTGKTLTRILTPSISNVGTRGNVLSLANNSYCKFSSYDIPASYTKMCWVYHSVFNNSGNLISSDGAGVPKHYIWYNGESNLNAGHRADGGIVSYVRDPNSTPLNTWTHFVVTYDQPSTTMIMYRNGVSVATTSNSAMSWSGGAGALGIGEFGGGNTLTGFIDNVHVFANALTSSQIAAIYAQELNGGNWDYTYAPNPVAYYDFTNTSSYSGTGSTTVNDLSGNGYNLAFNSAPTYNTSPKSITLTGSISAISTTNPSIDVSTNGFSFELLVKFASNPNNFPVAFAFVSTTTGDGAQIQLQPTSNKVYMWNNSVGNGLYTSSGITLNTWYHVVFTSTGQIYLNGSSVSTSTFTNQGTLTTTNRCITVGDQSRIRSIPGDIALVRLYNQALTSANVSFLYTAVKNLGSYGLP